LNAVVGVALTVPILGYIVSAVFTRRTSQAWIPLGEVRHFPERETRLASYRNPTRRPWDGKTADIPCWVRRIDGERFQIFAINCAHLGCPVRWFSESGLFLCPCHGGVYYEDGSVASGPPPRGLFEYEYRIEKDVLWVRGGQIPTLSEPV
jgi:Rieske Fe-S protein